MSIIFTLTPSFGPEGWPQRGAKKSKKEAGEGRWTVVCGPSFAEAMEDRAFAEVAEDEPDTEDGGADGTRESGVRLSDHPVSAAWVRMWGFGFG